MTRAGEPVAPGSPNLAALGEAVRRAEDENAEGHPADARRLLRPVLAALPADTGDPAVVRVRAWALIELVRSEAEVRGSAERALAELSESYAPEQFPKVTETFGELKGLPEPKEGTGLLVAVQPIPTPDKEEVEPQEKIAAPAVKKGDDATKGDGAPPENPDDKPPAQDDTDAPRKQPAVSAQPASAPAPASKDQAPKDEPADDVVN